MQPHEIADGAPEDLDHEQLRCPNCDYSVFGLTEQRCPECGEAFTWDDIRRSAAARGLFEYRWRSEPIRSLLHTWRLAAFQPVSLWRKIGRRDAPNLRPLLVFLAIQCLMFARGYPADGGIVRSHDERTGGVQGQVP